MFYSWYRQKADYDLLVQGRPDHGRSPKDSNSEAKRERSLSSNLCFKYSVQDESLLVSLISRKFLPQQGQAPIAMATNLLGHTAATPLG